AYILGVELATSILIGNVGEPDDLLFRNPAYLLFVLVLDRHLRRNRNTRSINYCGNCEPTQLARFIDRKFVRKNGSWKLLEKQKNGWCVTKKKIHLPNSSSMTEANHSHWRQRALFNIQQQDQSALRYSLVFSLSDNISRLNQFKN
ncbi:MAG: hypothetical protein KDD22_04150, partial [Bdellovibrionales bacterium]|nr:hypothetical protein [Bdellovibrionales bacterium]